MNTTFTEMAGNSATGEEAEMKPISDRVDEANENICEVKSGVEHANEGIDDIKKKMSEMSEKISASDFAKEKQQEKNKSVIENNGGVAGNQYVVHNITNNFGGYQSGLREVTERNNAPDQETKVYDLAKAEEFAVFGETFKAGEHFAIAIMLSVFEYVELDDLQNLKSRLLSELPKVVDEEGNEVAVRQNPYFSINSVLKTMQGKIYETDAGDKCIGLGNKRPLALKNLWEQFPSIHGSISRWLLDVSEIFEYRTNFDAYQITTALVTIIKQDFSAGVRHIFQRLYSNSNNAWLLGAITLMLYDDENYRDRILPIMNDWVSSRSQWLWKSAYYVYSYVKQGAENDKFDSELRKLLEFRLGRLIDFRIDIFSFDDVLYISRFLIYSERARTLVSKVLGAISKKCMGYDNKQILIMVYLLCLRTGYFAISCEYTAFPLVACDTKNQLLDIQPLVSISLQRYETRQMLFSLIEAYLKELSDYSVEEKVIKRIKAYFVLLAERNSRHVADIVMMLKNCKCQLADDIASTIKAKLYLTGGL